VLAEDLVGEQVEGELPEETASSELVKMSCRENCWKRPTWRTTARELPGDLHESWRKRASGRELVQESFQRELGGELPEES